MWCPWLHHGQSGERSRLPKDMDVICPRGWSWTPARLTRPKRLWLNQSQPFFLYVNAVGIILTTQAYADDNTEKPGHTFPSLLLVPCVRQHWLYEHFYFLCHINFPFGKKDCIKIIRLLMEGLITNKVGVFYPLCQTIFFIPCVRQIKWTVST